MTSAMFVETMENSTFCIVYFHSQVIYYAPAMKTKELEEKKGILQSN
jgi:hypothetical protein